MTNMPDREAFATAHVPQREGTGHGIALAEVRNPLLHKGIALWERQRAARRFPGRDDMSPRVLAGLLRNTVLVRGPFQSPVDVYVNPTDGWQSTSHPNASLRSSDPNQQTFGWAVAISGTAMVVGDPWQGPDDQKRRQPTSSARK